MLKGKLDADDFHGYRIPVRIEALGVKEFKRILALKGALLMIGEQIDVFTGPERLDLLAMDENGVLWIFEFKRDIGRPAAVGQLLTYGAYAASLDIDELNQLFRKSRQSKKGKITLAAAFKDCFGFTLPKIPHQVCLVLAAFEFSVTCDQLIGFLKHSVNLQIGKLKMEWEVSPNAPDGRHYEYIDLPRPMQGNAWPPNQSDYHTDTYMMLSLAIDVQSWEAYRKSEILLFPDLREISNTRWSDEYQENSREEPYHTLPASLDYQALKPGMGLFVYTYNCQSRTPRNEDTDPHTHFPKMFNEEMDEESERGTHGLLGFGIVRNRPRKITTENLALLHQRLNWPLNLFGTEFENSQWTVDVEWVATCSPDESPSVEGVPSETCMRQVETKAQAEKFLEALGISKSFLDVPF